MQRQPALGYMTGPKFSPARAKDVLMIAGLGALGFVATSQAQQRFQHTNSPSESRGSFRLRIRFRSSDKGSP